MRASIKHILSFVLIIYFLLAGTGFNIVKYCCDACYEHGIAEVAKHSCGAFHHDNHACCSSSEKKSEVTHEDMACSDISHHTSGCHILRLNIETPTFIAKVDKVQISVLQLFNESILIDTLLSTVSVFDLSRKFSPPNLLLSNGREILSLKSVLII